MSDEDHPSAPKKRPHATTKESGLLYFLPEYLQIQDYQNLKIVESKSFEACFEIDRGGAISLTYAPFGGIVQKTTGELTAFMDQVHAELADQMACHTIRFRLPPFYYPNMVSASHLELFGYREIFADENQYIDLKEPIEFHAMELRKLDKLQRQSLRVEPVEDLERIHAYIAECRKEQGLQINISRAHLMELAGRFSNRYSGWVVRDPDNTWLSAVIMVQPVQGIWYYYLPGTPERFRAQSPMVLLIAHLIEEAKKQGHEVLDLGLSSIRGERQEGLFEFKKRMCAKMTLRPTLERQL